MEVFLFALTLGATVFITMAYTHLPIELIPIYPALIAAIVLYAIRLLIHHSIHIENQVRYKRLRNDGHIKVYSEPKKSNVWKYILVAVLIVVVFLMYQCVSHQGMENFELPINLN